MSTPVVIVIVIIVLAVIIGGIFTLRSTAKMGMPDEDVLDRARRRAREMDARDKEDGRD